MPKIIDFNWEKLNGMLLFDASLPICSAELDVSMNTIIRNIKRKYDCTFEDYKKIYVGKTVLKLKQKMINVALGGNITALIFCLKNLSDWCDNPQEKINVAEAKEIILKYQL